MFPGQCGNTAFFFKSQPDQFHFEFRGIVFPGKSFFSAHEVSTCKISGCLSYRILDSGPDGTQTTLTIKGVIKTRNALVHRNGVTESLEPVYISSGSVQNAICTVRAFITVAAETLLQEDALYRTDDGIF